MFDKISDMHLGVLVLDGVFDLGLSSVLDTFALADQLSSSSPDGPRFKLELFGVGGEVRTQHGLIVPVGPVTDSRPDLVLVPANGCTAPGTLSAMLGRDDTRAATEQLRAWHAAGVEVAAACTGTYVVAQAGLLDGVAATTSWWLAADFRARFPNVALEESTMVVHAPGVVTAGAALAHVDLALWVIRRISPALASTTARYLLCDNRTSQAAYAIVDQIAHSDPAVERFEQWCREHLADFSMSAAARAVGMSERTLQRHVRRVLGRSPIAYVQDLRISRAIHRLQTSDATVDEIATEVGYSDGATLRTLLRRKTGRGMQELRGR
jgi:transcriptional regulator GlxA family with amidase domain